MNIRRFLLLILVIALSVTMMIGCAPAQPTSNTPTTTPSIVLNWKMGNLYARGEIYQPIYHQFCVDVTDMSDGRIQMEDIYDGEGYAMADLFKLVGSGMIETGAPFVQSFASDVPESSIEAGLPGGPQDFAQLMILFYEKGWLDILREAYATQNTFYLATYPQPGAILFTRKPINSLSDLKSMKIRGSGVYSAFTTKLGAAPATVPFAEVYTSLATGVIDGNSTFNILDYKSLKLWEVAPYIYPMLETGAQMGPLIINKDLYDELPSDLAAIVEKAALLMGYDSMNKCAMWAQSAASEMTAQGMKYSPAPSAEDQATWVQSGMSLWDEYASKNSRCAEMIQIEKDYMQELGY